MALPANTAAQLDAAASETGTSRVALVRSAIDAFLAAQDGHELTVNLSDGMRVDFASFLRASFGANPQFVIEEALHSFIKKVLDENPGIRARFFEAQGKIRETGEGANGKIIVFDQTRVS